jgi:putative addiction module component (TIGR02574 family)
MIQRKSARDIDFSELSAPDRFELMELIWESLEADPDAWELSSEQLEMLDRRSQEMRDDPSCTITWEEMQKRLKLQP